MRDVACYYRMHQFLVSKVLQCIYYLVLVLEKSIGFKSFA